MHFLPLLAYTFQMNQKFIRYSNSGCIVDVQGIAMTAAFFFLVPDMGISLSSAATPSETFLDISQVLQ